MSAIVGTPAIRNDPGEQRQLGALGAHRAGRGSEASQGGLRGPGDPQGRAGTRALRVGQRSPPVALGRRILGQEDHLVRGVACLGAAYPAAGAYLEVAYPEVTYPGAAYPEAACLGACPSGSRGDQGRGDHPYVAVQGVRPCVEDLEAHPYEVRRGQEVLP